MYQQFQWAFKDTKMETCSKYSLSKALNHLVGGLLPDCGHFFISPYRNKLVLNASSAIKSSKLMDTLLKEFCWNNNPKLNFQYFFETEAEVINVDLNKAVDIVTDISFRVDSLKRGESLLKADGSGLRFSSSNKKLFDFKYETIQLPKNIESILSSHRPIFDRVIKASMQTKNKTQKLVVFNLTQFRLNQAMITPEQFLQGIGSRKNYGAGGFYIAS